MPGYAFISLVAQELWNSIVETLGVCSGGWRPIDGPFRSWFDGAKAPLLKVLGTHWKDTASEQDFQSQLTHLDDVLKRWDVLNKSYWNSSSKDKRQGWANKANDLAREFTDVLQRNKQLRDRLRAAGRGVEGLVDADMEFEAVCQRLAENVIVGLECIWDGGTDFVRAAWSLASLARECRPAVGEGTLKQLADGWLKDVMARWTNDTQSGEAPGPMDRVMNEALTLNSLSEKLDAALADPDVKRKDVQKLLEKVVDAAGDVMEALRQAEGRSYGKSSAFDALSPGLSAVLTESISAAGSLLEPGTYGGEGGPPLRLPEPGGPPGGVPGGPGDPGEPKPSDPKDPSDPRDPGAEPPRPGEGGDPSR